MQPICSLLLNGCEYHPWEEITFIFWVLLIDYSSSSQHWTPCQILQVMEMPSAKVFLLIYLTEQTAATVALIFGNYFIFYSKLITLQLFMQRHGIARPVHVAFGKTPCQASCYRMIFFLICSAFKNTVIYYESKALYYNHQVFRQYFIVKLINLNYMAKIRMFYKTFYLA